MLTFFLVAIASAQDFRTPPKLQVSFQPNLGYKAGSIGEHLFNTDNYGKPVDFAPSGGRQISFLQWDINSLLVAELEIGFRYKAFLSQINGEIGFPMRVGKMNDYDWNSTKGHQTHFST
ncbi:MAG: omptin family outer membrane protease, partial [Spirochaetaceae bacterium]|nr:omptin family outer membrane protease [Spirochaetaceae bacterium]